MIENENTTADEQQAEAGEVGAAGIKQIEVVHTFEPAHVFRMRDVLADRIRLHGSGIPADTAGEIAEGIITDHLTDLAVLNRYAIAANGSVRSQLDLCRDGSCDGPSQGSGGHEHGEMCGPLCACGKGH